MILETNVVKCEICSSWNSYSRSRYTTNQLRKKLEKMGWLTNGGRHTYEICSSCVRNRTEDVLSYLKTLLHEKEYSKIERKINKVNNGK